MPAVEVMTQPLAATATRTPIESDSSRADLANGFDRMIMPQKPIEMRSPQADVIAKSVDVTLRERESRSIVRRPSRFPAFPGMPPHRPASQSHTFSYSSDASGRPLKLTVSLPSASLKAPAAGWPVLFAIHGGGWQKFDRRDILAKTQALANEGFAIVAPDFTKASARSPSWPRNLGDLQTALGWTALKARELGLNADDMTLIGESSGAHLAALLAIVSANSNDSSGGPLVDKLITIAAPMALTDHNGMPALTVERIREMIGVEFAVNNSLWHSVSPHSLIEASGKIRMPKTLLIHGKTDSVVPVGQAVQFSKLLYSKRLDHRLVVFESAGHELLSGPFGSQVNQTIRDFLKSDSIG